MERFSRLRPPSGPSALCTAEHVPYVAVRKRVHHTVGRNYSWSETIPGHRFGAAADRHAPSVLSGQIQHYWRLQCGLLDGDSC
jgi:hypothetical protein